jgi:hypothetical protein
MPYFLVVGDIVMAVAAVPAVSAAEVLKNFLLFDWFMVNSFQ